MVRFALCVVRCTFEWVMIQVTCLLPPHISEPMMYPCITQNNIDKQFQPKSYELMGDKQFCKKCKSNSKYATVEPITNRLVCLRIYNSRLAKVFRIQ